MTAGSRRNGTSKLGPFGRPVPGPARPGRGGRGGYSASFGTALVGGAALAGAGALDSRSPWGRTLDYSGRHVSHRAKPARTRASVAVPAVAVAATLVAGAAAYTLAGVAHTHVAGLNGAAALSGTVGGTSGAAAASAAAVSAAAVSAAAVSAAAVSASAATAAISGVATATAAVPRPAHAYVPRHAKAAAKPAAVVATTTAAAPSTPTATRAAAVPAATASAAPTPVATPSHPAAATLSCATSGGGLLPENVTAIVSFLLAHGYSDNAAAGIAGNIYQESTGNPEAVGDGGGGLIGWTPLPAGYITGDVSADLETQLAGVLTYNQEWASYLSALNSAATPADAAYVYVTDFERAGIPAAATRETSADDVASACGI